MRELVLLFAVLPFSVVGFTPKPTKCLLPSDRAGLLSRKKSLELFMSATEEKKTEGGKLSAEDEEILFGEKATPSRLDGSDRLPPFSPARRRHFSKTGNLLESSNLPLNPLDHSQTDPLINALKKTRETVSSCPGLWTDLAKLCGEKRALLDEHMCDEKVDLTFGEMEEVVRRSAAMFLNLGMEKGDSVAVFGENSAKWLMVDHGIQLAGGASAVRGADAPADELRYIYEHSDSAGIVVLQDLKLLDRLAAYAKTKGLSGLGLDNDKHGPVKTVILMHRGKKSDEDIAARAEALGVNVSVFSDVLDKTTPLPKNASTKIGREDLSTIVYTSGTTGRPKGVMLTHGNLLHQLGHRLSPTQPYDTSEPLPGELMLAILPVWHITERTFELWLLSRGCHVVYSSIRTFKNDLAKHKPQWMVLVPRVLEKVYQGVQAKFSSGSAVAKGLVKFFTNTGTMRAESDKISAGLAVASEKPGSFSRLKAKAVSSAISPLNSLGDKLVWSKVREGFGGRIKTIIAGGSALAGSLEAFYELAGIPICVGYGLTECSPLIAHRRADANLVTAGCVGKPTLDTEIRIVDPDVRPEFGERQPLPDGEIGVVIARGPQIMRGYYKNPEATDKAIDRFGWFDTGDLGKVNPSTGDIILTGRCKDTIVLSNGENIEPTPIEDAILTSSNLIEQVMLTGQDGRRLVAIAVLNPESLASSGYISKAEGKSLGKAYDKMNDPKCTEQERESATKTLQDASKTLRSSDVLGRALKQEVKKATSDFRQWEQVSSIYITLEPFAMVNGLLTQSYKVKRNIVSKRYENEIKG